MISQPPFNIFRKIIGRGKSDPVIKNLRHIVEQKEQFLESVENHLSVEFPGKDDPVLKALNHLAEEILKTIRIEEEASLETLEKGIERMQRFEIDGKRWIESYEARAVEYTRYLQEHGMENIIDETEKLKHHKAN